MRKLIYYVAVSLDGFIAAPDGGTDFFPVDGDHMPWLVDNYPETIPGHLRGVFGLEATPPREFDTVLMGRATHQVAVDGGLASGYPHLRQYVVTSHGGDLPPEVGLTAVDEDPVSLVRRLKAESSPLDIWLCGGGALAAAVADEIDEFRLKINPLLLGDGIPLLDSGATRAEPGASQVVSGTGPGAAGREQGPSGSALPLYRRMVREFASGVTYTEYART